MILTLAPGDVLPDLKAVLAAMGGSGSAAGQGLPGDAAVRAVAQRGLAAASTFMQPRVAWVVRPLARVGDELQVLARSRAEAVLRWRATAALGRLDGAGKAGLLVATLGSDLEEEATDAFHRGEYLLGLALDAIGSIAVHRLANQARRHMGREAQAEGLVAGHPAGPGYDGWPLDDLPGLVAAAGGPAAGVRLTTGFMLNPQKSLCLVLPWVGPERGAGRVAPDEVAE